MKKILILILLFSFSVQGQTIQQVRDLITENLASGTKITAVKHREVENAIVNLVENNQPYLYKGTYTVGNLTTSDEIRTITFPNVGTSSYIVVGSLVSFGSNYNNDNDVIWTVKNKTGTQFNLLLREIAAVTQNLEFNYVLIPL